MAFIHTIGKATDPWHVPGHKHDTMAEARECETEAANDYEGHLNAQAECAAEERYERFLEDGGQYAAQIQYENQLDEMMAEAHR